MLALAAILLAGCSDAQAAVKDPKTAIFSVGDQTLTKGEMYSFMTARDAGYFAINESKKVILENEVPVTEEMKTEAQAALDSYKAMLGDNFNDYLASYGFADEEDYLNNNLILSLRAEQLTKNFITENYDTMVSRYTPKKIKLMQFTALDKATAALQQVKDGGNFDEVATANGSAVSAAETIATVQSQYPATVLTFLGSTTDPTLSEVIVDDNGTNFYIVQVLSTNANDFKDQAIDTFAAIPQLSSEASVYYFEKYGFTVYDITIYNQLKANYKEYLIQDKK